MSTIAIVAPSSPIKNFGAEHKSSIRSFFHNLGYDTKFMPHVHNPDRFLAASDEQRAADIMAAFTDPEVDAIVCLRGGCGSSRILDKLDYDVIAAHPKLFFGFSDTTTLQLALWHCAHHPSMTGFVAGCVCRSIGEMMMKTLTSNLKQPRELQTISGLTPLTKGRASGLLLGGNLINMVSLIGTPYMPDMTGAILLIEEVGEQPYAIDRMLTQLRLVGILDRLAGVVLGTFHHCDSKDPADDSIDEVLNDFFANAPYPVVKNFPYGHTVDHVVIPMAQTVELDADAGILRL